MNSDDDRTKLARALAEARARGFLGPGPVEDHIQQAAVLARSRDAGWTGRVLDLGSGAGVPGLLLALAWPNTGWVLLDAHRRRAVFAQEAARDLGLGDRVQVHIGRAEEAGHLPALRGSFDAVVARGFGPPGVTAECGAPFVRAGGELWVSEPPEEAHRWPGEGLALVGLSDAKVVTGAHGRWRVLRATAPCPSEYPRRVGIPRRRPLF